MEFFSDNGIHHETGFGLKYLFCNIIKENISFFATIRNIENRNFLESKLQIQFQVFVSQCKNREKHKGVSKNLTYTCEQAEKDQQYPMQLKVSFVLTIEPCVFVLLAQQLVGWHGSLFHGGSFHIKYLPPKMSVSGPRN